MKPTLQLFHLIKSLSKSEKRYFKLYSSIQSGDKIYMKLFDVIDKEKVYNEESIKQKLKKDISLKHFPSQKNHLYGQILKSLGMFHSESSVGSILKEQLREIEILYNKALYKECNKVVSRAKKLAYDTERFHFIFEILNWEKQLSDDEQILGTLEENLRMINKEEEEVILKMRNLGDYHLLYSQINYVFRQGGYTRNSKEREIVDRVSSDPLIIEPKMAISARSITMCFYIKGLCAVANNKLKEAVNHFLRILELMDQNPLVAKDLRKRSIKTYNYLLLAYIELGQYDNVFKLISKMRSLDGYDSIYLKAKIFTATSNAEIVTYARMGEFKKGIEKLDFILKGIEQFSGKITKESEMLFYYNIAYLYFGLGNYHKALHWVNQLLNDNQVTGRLDICSFGRILNLLIHSELQNHDLLKHIINSTQRFQLKHQRNYKFEMLILSYFTKTMKVNSLKEKMSLFEKIKEELQEVVKDEYEKIALQYIDFISWIKSKIERRSFEEVIREKAMLT